MCPIKEKKWFLHAAILQRYINVLNILLYFKENYYLYSTKAKQFLKEFQLRWIWLKVVSLKGFYEKERRRDFQWFSSARHPVTVLFSATSYSHCQLGTSLPMANTLSSFGFVLHHTQVSKGAMKNICNLLPMVQWIFFIIIFLLPIGRDAMNTFSNCPIRNKDLSSLGNRHRILFTIGNGATTKK